MRRYSVLLILAALAALAVHERGRLFVLALPLRARIAHDVPYGPYPENRLDIMQPRWGAAPTRPAVLVFHGGGWTSGSREEMLYRACRRYLEYGFVVANADYRLGSIPAAIEDALQALDWFQKHAASYGADPARIVVTGYSAGAHLALMSAFRSPTPPAAVVNFYGMTDLDALADRPPIRQVLSGANPRSVSPIMYVHRGMPPVFSIHGTADDIVPPDQTAKLTGAIRNAGGEALELYIEGGGHGLTTPQEDRAYGAVFEFLADHGI